MSRHLADPGVTARLGSLFLGVRGCGRTARLAAARLPGQWSSAGRKQIRQFFRRATARRQNWLPGLLLLPLAALAAGCDGGAKDDTADTGDTADSEDTTETADTTDTADSGDTTDSADTGDSGDTGDTGPVGDDGLLTWNGSADVDGHWLGWESVVFQGNMGLGDVLCEIRHPVEDIGPRDDCAECEVAFDVQLGAGEVRVDERCAAAGEDASTIAAREGQVRGYGFALNYLGHSNVLMYDDAGVWKAVAFVDWDEEALSLTYAWEQAVISY